MCNIGVKTLFTFKFSNIDNPPFFQTCFINACASDTLLSWKRGTLQGNDVQRSAKLLRRGDNSDCLST